MTAEPDQTAALAEGVEQLREACATVVTDLEDAAVSVGHYAYAIADLVQDIDARRTELNRRARKMHAEPVPDFFAPCGGQRARLVAAARKGPEATAVAVGKVARSFAAQPPPQAAPEAAFTAAGVDAAGQGAAALLTAMHHGVSDLDAGELIGAASAIEVAVILATITLNLAGRLELDVAAWLVEMATESALCEEVSGD